MYPSTDHALHWVMIFLGGILGYGVGLMLIAGRSASTLAGMKLDGRRIAGRGPLDQGRGEDEGGASWCAFVSSAMFAVD